MQSYDAGWIAVTPTSSFPFFKSAGNHVLVNNWENGWVLPKEVINNPPSRKATDGRSTQISNKEISNGDTTIILFFWPQILEWIGFALLPLPFLYAFRMKNFKKPLAQ